MLSATQLESYITEHLACDYIKVLGDDGTHFEAVIVSSAFEGKTMIQQHQLVYAALGRSDESRDTCALHADIDACKMGRDAPKLNH